ELNKTLTSLTKYFDRIFKRAKLQKNLIVYIPSVEVTHNEKENTYHHHIHVLRMVKTSYFSGSGNNYIYQKEWGDMWSQSLKVDYIPLVDIRSFKANENGLK
ncbi:protein rep, partial [Streptococcus agalactiae]|nr:protein rep [Streptococcus agalactiae]